MWSRLVYSRNTHSRKRHGPLSNLEVFLEKVKFLNLKMRFASKYEGFSNNFIVKCTPTIERLGNTDLLYQMLIQALA